MILLSFFNPSEAVYLFTDSSFQSLSLSLVTFQNPVALSIAHLSKLHPSLHHSARLNLPQFLYPMVSRCSEFILTLLCRFLSSPISVAAYEPVSQRRSVSPPWPPGGVCLRCSPSIRFHFKVTSGLQLRSLIHCPLNRNMAGCILLHACHKHS